MATFLFCIVLGFHFFPFFLCWGEKWYECTFLFHVFLTDLAYMKRHFVLYYIDTMKVLVLAVVQYQAFLSGGVSGRGISLRAGKINLPCL